MKNGCECRRTGNLDKLYESTKDWVSVEVELNKTMKPSVLFHLTEKDAGTVLHALK